MVSTGVTLNGTTLDLRGWDLVITADTPQDRPDPTTGNLLIDPNPTSPTYNMVMSSSLNYYGPIPLDGTQAFNPPPGQTTGIDVQLLPLLSSQQNADVQPGSLQTGAMPPTNYYYVIGTNPATPAGAERPARDGDRADPDRHERQTDLLPAPGGPDVQAPVRPHRHDALPFHRRRDQQHRDQEASTNGA